MSPAQLMKTETVITLSIYAMFYGMDVLGYYPDLNLMRRFIAARLRPAVMAMGFDEIQPSGDSSLIKQRDSAQELRYIGMGSYLGLTPSLKTGTTSYTANVILIDEIDRCRQADMIGVAKSRSITYRGRRKIVAISTPTTDEPGTIHDLYNRGSRGVYHGKCPHCKGMFSLDWDMVQFKKDADGLWLTQEEGGNVQFPCSACGVVLSEQDRALGIRYGSYIHQEPSNPIRTFWVPGCGHHWNTIENMQRDGALAYKLAYQHSDWKNYILWINEVVCKPWLEADTRGISAAQLRDAQYTPGPRGAGTLGRLDERVLCITVGVDTGLRQINAEWCAWGWCEETKRVLCWGLKYETFGGKPADRIFDDPRIREDFRKAVFNWCWEHPTQGNMRASLALVDCGDGSRTQEIREWTTKWQQQEAREKKWKTITPWTATILPYKSSSTNVPYADGSLVDKNRTMRLKTERGLTPTLAMAWVNGAKNIVYQSLMVDKRTGNYANRTPIDGPKFGYDRVWRKGFSSEVPVHKRNAAGHRVLTFQNPQGNPARGNEAWDCRIYSFLCLSWLGHPYDASEYLKGLLQKRKQDVLTKKVKSNVVSIKPK